MRERNVDLKKSDEGNLYLSMVDKEKIKTIQLKNLLSKNTILVFQPGMSLPDEPLPTNWMSTEGAPGCTGQMLAYKELKEKIDLRQLNVYFVTSKFPEHQVEVAKQREIPFGIICDPNLFLKNALNIPTFSVENKEYYRRQTCVVINGKVNKIFQSTDPKSDAKEVLHYLKNPELSLQDQLEIRQSKLPDFLVAKIKDKAINVSPIDELNYAHWGARHVFFKQEKVDEKKSLQAELDLKIKKALGKKEVQDQIKSYRGLCSEHLAERFIQELKDQIANKIMEEAKNQERFQPLFKLEQPRRNMRDGI